MEDPVDSGGALSLPVTRSTDGILIAFVKPAFTLHLTSVCSPGGGVVVSPPRELSVTT